MKTQIALSLTLFLAAGAIVQAEPLTVAVYDFTGDGDAANYGGKVTTLVTADLTAETNVIMLERADLTKVLNEQAFSISGMVSSDAAAKIGQITGVKVLVAGQVIKDGDNNVMIFASIIGTETGRLFMSKAKGPADNLVALTAELGREIARTISSQATNLAPPPVEPQELRIERMVKNLTGTNRPSVSINITAYNGLGQSWRDDVFENEAGAILLKAGFTVVSDSSDKKPDVQIVGSASGEAGLPRGGLLTGHATVTLKIEERRTGNIIAFDSQESTATDLGANAANNAATIKCADELAERILPLLAQ